MSAILEINVNNYGNKSHDYQVRVIDSVTQNVVNEISERYRGNNDPIDVAYKGLAIGLLVAKSTGYTEVSLQPSFSVFNPQNKELNYSEQFLTEVTNITTLIPTA